MLNRFPYLTNKLKKLFIWIAISLILQITALTYIEYVYLPGRTSIVETVKAYETGEYPDDAEMRLPEGTTCIKVSYDGLYVGYLVKDRLTVADLHTGRTIRAIQYMDAVVSYFRWLPDREMLIYTLERSGETGNTVTVMTCDIDTSVERGYPPIMDLPGSSTTLDIELSPLTNVVNVIISLDPGRVKVYKYNIVDELEYLMTAGTGTVFFSEHAQRLSRLSGEKRRYICKRREK